MEVVLNVYFRISVRLNYIIQFLYNLYLNECINVFHPCNRQLLHFPGLEGHFLPTDLSPPPSTVLDHLVKEELQELNGNFFFPPTNILLFLLQKNFKHTVRNFSTGSSGDSWNISFCNLDLIFWFSWAKFASIPN